MNDRIAPMPERPADYFENPKSRAAYETALAQHIEGAPASAAGVLSSAGHQVTTAQGVTAPAGGSPNAEDLAILNSTQGHKLPDGKSAYFSNPKFRETIERLRTEVFAGKPLDREAATAELQAALGLGAAPQPGGEPAGEWAESCNVNGYTVDAGAHGYQMNPNDPQLHAVTARAREAGISQEQFSALLAAYLGGLR